MSPTPERERARSTFLRQLPLSYGLWTDGLLIWGDWGGLYINGMSYVYPTRIQKSQHALSRVRFNCLWEINGSTLFLVRCNLLFIFSGRVCDLFGALGKSKNREEFLKIFSKFFAKSEETYIRE
jgi:hypothetical protein